MLTSFLVSCMISVYKTPSLFVKKTRWRSIVVIGLLPTYIPELHSFEHLRKR